MKHKILLASEPKSDLDNLLVRMCELLNKTHTKYLSVFFLSEFQEANLVAAYGASHASNGLSDIMVRIEEEARMEGIASDRGFHFEFLKGISAKNKLKSTSRVFDLAVLESKIFNELDDRTLRDLCDNLECSILILPEKNNFNELYVVNDGSINSVRMMKSFLGMFNSSLRDLPLSVFVMDPENNLEIESEKVFIDYLKLYFPNIGIQMLCEEPMDTIAKEVNNHDMKPLLMPSSAYSPKEIIKHIRENPKFQNNPIYIYKG